MKTPVKSKLNINPEDSVIKEPQQGRNATVSVTLEPSEGVAQGVEEFFRSVYWENKRIILLKLSVGMFESVGQLINVISESH